MENTKLSKLKLKNASNIAVIGGGPSGSFFSFYALKLAKAKGIDLKIDIFEAKDFNCLGATGCNHCGGIISESFIQLLAEDDIILPHEAIKKGIDSYTLHFDQTNSVIERQSEEQRIAMVYRGLGPKACRFEGKNNLDEYMLDLCETKGANIIHEKVIKLERNGDKIILGTNNNLKKEYDFVVGAIGINQKVIGLFDNLCPSLIPPRKARSHICEIHLVENKIDTYFGNSMHIFLLNLPNISYAALIPKGSHISLVIIGEDINKDVVDNFLESEKFKKCFPPNIDLNKIISCRSYPYINIRASKLAYADRLVLIGDASVSKLYKEGLRTAFLTAKAAVNTALNQGISENDFKKYFAPLSDNLKRDNYYAKFVFSSVSILQKSALLKSALYRIIANEKGKLRNKRKISAMLWDTFTGNATYTSIFLRFFNLGVIFSLLWNSILVLFRKSKNAIT